MTTYLRSINPNKPIRHRFLKPRQPMQRTPDMLTDDAEAHLASNHDKERRKFEALLWLLLRDLGVSEAHYGAFEMSSAQGVVFSQDASGNVKVMKDS